MIKGKFNLLIIFVAFYNLCFAQNVTIINYDVNNFGQVQLEIEGQSDQYYLLTALHEPNLNYETVTSMTIGQDGLMTISEPLSAFGIQNYKITAHSIASPDDTDGDGYDDITEFNNMPAQSPLNFAEEVPLIDGRTSITDHALFSELAVINSDIPWAPFLNNQEFAKFAIVHQESEEPEVYFINSNTHYIHADFLATINVDYQDATTGEIVYNPNEILPNGAIGSYSFNYSFGDSYSFERTRRTFELLAANMPFLKNNLQHFIADQGEYNYLNNYIEDYDGSRINVVLESELFADIDFLPFNQAEGYGFFRHMQLDENPGSRDIVLYDALPNSLPRVGGIITSVIQTPLSHVNLRAIQDNLPNAYIKEPLLIDSISNLLDKYIYYKVEQDRYVIREATLDEVNEWYEDIRPTEEQIPDRDLTQTRILPLDEVEFEMSTAFGAKCSNVATMRKFGFPDGTIPNGYGVPFYFYDEFMKFNDFYTQADDMITNPDFIADLEIRIDMLKEFRKEIRAADMPQWMLDSLQVMHDAFPEGTAVRCRSSTNNEDLPGFSGAGLYTSKTQHLDEGHISKSIKQVYASMWNFRAFDERDFYRVDHFIAAMGVLCHPNFEEEKSNGVGVSIDPIFQTENTFYLNTQVGESLITNPEENTIPEEILLNQDPAEGYIVLRYSNLVPDEQLIMDESYLDLMRDYLQVIHDEFAILYNVVGAEGFGMDIEYKVTAEDQLIIKQARPWVSFWADIKSNYDLAVTEILEPQNSSTLSDAELISVQISNKGLKDITDFDISLLVEDVIVETISITDELSPQDIGEYQFTIPQDLSAIGDYNIGAIVSHPSDGYDKNDTLKTVVSHLHYLEGGISAKLRNQKCGDEIEATATVTNYGESIFSNTQIEVVVNGIITDTIIHSYSIPYLAEVDISFIIGENLEETGNDITLNLISINGQQDAVMSNNSSSFQTDLNNTLNYLTLNIIADDFPEEISWLLYNDPDFQVIAEGNLGPNDQIVNENICIETDECFVLVVYDSAQNGICCDNGDGSIQVLNGAGNILMSNDGNYEDIAVEFFCFDDECLLTADVVTTKTTNQNTMDGSITINASGGTAPYVYSIDGGNFFYATNTFENLPIGNYSVIIRDSTIDCLFQIEVEVEPEILISVDDISIGKIKLFPNPTDGTFVITMEDSSITSSPVEIEIYDYLGKVIQTHSMSKTNGASQTSISLENNPSGTYIAKCFNEHFEKTFKVIKI